MQAKNHHESGCQHAKDLRRRAEAENLPEEARTAWSLVLVLDERTPTDSPRLEPRCFVELPLHVRRKSAPGHIRRPASSLHRASPRCMQSPLGAVAAHYARLQVTSTDLYQESVGMVTPLNRRRRTQHIPVGGERKRCGHQPRQSPIPSATSCISRPSAPTAPPGGSQLGLGGSG